jgi:O-antigen biosynthesis protein WbqV
MLRYFMTIREACDLVISAASHALESEPSASVYVLNMGQPVKILDLAERMIRLSGLEPGRDIDIVFTGIRPGERLNEILFASDEAHAEVGIEGVVAAKPAHPSQLAMKRWLQMLEEAVARGERPNMMRVLQEAVSDFRGTAA